MKHVGYSTADNIYVWLMVYILLPYIHVTMCLYSLGEEMSS